MNKTRDPNTKIKRLNTRTDLQGSAFRRTIMMPSSLFEDDDASSICSMGQVKNPYVIPVIAAPK